MTTASDLLYAERQALADACRTLAGRGLVVGTAGNLSVRVDELVAVTATGARFESITADEVTVVDLAGNVVAGGLEPTSELGMHLGIYERYGAGAVVHTHAPMATAVGLVTDELPCIHYQMLLLGGAVPVAPYATFGTPELAGYVLDALAGKNAALMANHGAINHSSTLDKAMEAALILEWACGIYLQAKTVAEPRVLDAAAQEAVVLAALASSYGSTKPSSQESS